MRSFARWIFTVGLLVLALLTLSACSFNLAGDLTPPPGWQPTPVPPTPDVASLYPALPPDPVAGKAIYTQICLPCHGETGRGDGPLAAERGLNPANFADPEDVYKDTPVQRFIVLTRGRPEKGMPPFGDKLTARQRWDVLAYIYTLGVPPDVLSRGKTIFAERCAVCHQSDGRGKELVDQKRMAQWSDKDFVHALTGKQHEPKVYQGLSADDQRAVVAYVRTLAFAHPVAATPTAEPVSAEETPEPAATAQATSAEETPAADTITVTGDVANGTAGGSVPADLEITLYAYDDPHSGQAAYTATTTTDAQGHFVFRNVPWQANRVFFATAKYEGVLYGSHDVTPSAEQKNIDLPVTIYETTTDLGQVSVERLHILAEVVSPDVLQMVEIYVITNSGDRTVVAAKKDAPVLTFHLPAGASHLQFQNGALGGRYVQTEDGFGDLWPIYPQMQTQEVFAYHLPLTGKKVAVSHPVSLPVAGAVLMTREGELTLSGDMLQDAGVTSSQDATQGTEAYHVYNVGALPAGGVLKFTVEKHTNLLGAGGSGNSKAGLAIGLMALGAALLAVAVVLRREQSAEPAAAGADGDDATAWAARFADDAGTLADAILALDDLYKEGQLEEEVYQARRQALKARLQDLLAAQEGQEGQL